MVGEIGIDRREYLYELSAWEIMAIERGYRRRMHPLWDMARLIAHQVHYAMGVPSGHVAKTPQEWLPLPWERAVAGTISEEDRARLLNIINKENTKAM